MPYLKKIDTSVLLIILRSHVNYYAMSQKLGQARDCHTTMKQVRAEITARGETIQLADKPLFDFIDKLDAVPG